MKIGKMVCGFDVYWGRTALNNMLENGHVIQIQTTSEGKTTILQL